MAGLEIAHIAADRLNRPRAEVAEIQLAIMRADGWPRDRAEQLALILLCVLFGATDRTAAPIAATISELRDGDDLPAAEFVARLIRWLRDGDEKAGLAFRSYTYCESGDGLAVRVQFDLEDGRLDHAFTNDRNGYLPHRDESVGLALALPGRALLRASRDLLEIPE